MILIVGNKGGNVSSLKKSLDRLKVKYEVKNNVSLFNHIDTKNINGIILSGGSLMLDKDIYFKEIRADIACLLNYDVPVLGICLGHEIIGDAFGAEISKLKNPVLTKRLKIKISKKSPIFTGVGKEAFVYENHHDYVKNLPDTLEVTASSDKIKVEAFQHKSKPIFGVQFHPEESSDIGDKVLENFVNFCREYRK